MALGIRHTTVKHRPSHHEGQVMYGCLIRK